MDFADQVVVINDAAHSVGRATALLMAQRGARLALGYDDRPEAVAELAATCAELHGAEAVLTRPLRRTQRADVDALIEQALARWGRIDALVNCSGVTPAAPIASLSVAQWQATLEAQLQPVFYSAQAALRPMMRQRYGRIVTVAALYGVSGGFEMADYAAAMGGLIGLTRAAARELAPWGITVNAVAPGLVDAAELATVPAEFVAWSHQFISLRRLGRPEEVAGAVCFLASTLASYITGQVLTVDGGFRIA